MRELGDIRQEINAVDEQLGKLFERRMALAEDVALYKQAHDLPVLDKEREARVLESRTNAFPGRDQEFIRSVRVFYQTLMDLSKEAQVKRINRPVTIGFYGAYGSFTHEAFLRLFGEETKSQSFEAFEAIFQALAAQEIRYGVLPVENSLTGIINDVYDLLSHYDFYIVREAVLPIQQNLLGVPGASLDQIQEVYSHPQGFAQSTQFLSQYPQWKLIPYFNTAHSAALVEKEHDQTKACIAGQGSARLYHLATLKEGIQDARQNFTRFVVISRSMETGPEANKISLYFTLDHKPGSLYGALEAFSQRGLNLLKIESRPMKGKVWEYGFFVDIEGNLADEKVVETLQMVRNHCRSWKILGNYKA